MRTLVAVAFATAVVAMPVQDDGRKQDITIVKTEDVRWTETKGLPPGMKLAVLHGEPDTGPFLMLLRVSANTRIAPHWHSAEEVGTIVSGTVLFGTGDVMDDTKGTELQAGAYIKIPAKAPHWAIARTDTVIVRYGAGRMETVYCNPKDDPSRKD